MPQTTTLLDLVRAFDEVGATDREIAFALIDLVETGRLRFDPPEDAR